jgi:hypothetical protein
MKSFLNVIGALALIGSVLVFFNAKSAVHEIEACMALLLGCTCIGLAKLIEGQESSAKLLTALSKILTDSTHATNAAISSSSHAPFPIEALPPVPGKEKYFVSDGVRAVGPYEVEKIQALAAKGTINKDTYILKQGTKEWLKLGAVFEL